MLNLKRAQGDHLGLDYIVLLFYGLRAEFKPVDILQSTLILGLQVTVQRVQSVQLGFELQAKLHFFFVRADVLVDLFLQLDTQLDFFIKLLAQLAVFAIDVIQGQLQLLLILVKLVDLLVEVFLHLFNLLLMLRANLGYQHLVVRLAAVLQQDRVDLPDGR